MRQANQTYDRWVKSDKFGTCESCKSSVVFSATEKRVATTGKFLSTRTELKSMINFSSLPIYPIIYTLPFACIREFIINIVNIFVLHEEIVSFDYQTMT